MMNNFKDIVTANQINSLIEEKSYSHTYYYHYSDLDGINGILNSKKIYVSSMCFSNDISEHSKFGDETYRYFQLCFSTGTTENLPLWFLYSGTNGKGGRISLSKKSIQKWINFENMKMELVCDIKETNDILKNNENCKIEFKDIIYCHKESGKYRLKYNTQVNNNFYDSEMQSVEKDNKGFLKDIIWFYEKETRLLVKVAENMIDKTLFQHAEKSPYRIELSIPDNCYKDIGIMLSPVFDGSNSEELNTILKQEGFSKLNNAKSMSEYAGQVKIDLCKNCDKCNKCQYKTAKQKNNNINDG